MNEWANAWTSYYTAGKGNYMISAMEDAGTMQSLTFLSHSNRVDLQRVLVLALELQRQAQVIQRGADIALATGVIWLAAQEIVLDAAHFAVDFDSLRNLAVLPQNTGHEEITSGQRLMELRHFRVIVAKLLQNCCRFAIAIHTFVRSSGIDPTTQTDRATAP